MVSHLNQQFGHYVLVRLIDSGGFADVYLGKHIYLKTYAAIKVMKTHLAGEQRQEFLREARIIADLDHRHIVRMLDFSLKAGVPYLVMNYAANGSLRKQHPQGTRLPLDRILDYVQQIANALEYIHAQGLIHMDVKPENILLGRNNEVMLSDFGIATIAHTSSFDRMQDFTGTLAYTAPERFEGSAYPASDQYALGIIVYEWLTGERPFQGAPAQIVQQHRNVPPPALSTRFPDISPNIEQVVLKSLEKDPRQRFASVQDFANALRQAVDSAPPLPELGPQASLKNKFELPYDIVAFFSYDLFASVLLSIILYLCGLMPYSILLVFTMCLLTLPIISALAQKNWPIRIIAFAVSFFSGIVGTLAHSVSILAVTQIGLWVFCSVVFYCLGLFRKSF